jgi:cobalt/nickel transport system permease protein
MAGSLFLRALERSDRIYLAMVSRGYDGEVRTMPLPGLKTSHWIILSCAIGTLAVLLMIAYLLWA